MSVIGIDLGGTKISSALFSSKGEIYGFQKIFLNDKKGQEVSQLIKTQILSLISENDITGESITSVGVSIPGIYYKDTGKVWVPNIEGWENYPLLKELKEVVKGKNITIKIADDRACYILGEVWKGKAIACKNAIFIAVGTGIGAGVLIDGKVLNGSNGIAGAIGWLALNKPYDKKYISCGCNEYYASGDGLARYANELIASKPCYTGVFMHKEVNSFNLIKEYGNNEEIAESVINNAIEYWGMTVANLVSIFNPEKVIFGGGVFGGAAKFLDKIYLEAKKWGQPIAMKQVKLETSENGAMAGLYGAAYLAINTNKKSLNYE